MAFCCGLLLCPSVMAFWFGGLLIEGGLLVESGLLLWPSVVAPRRPYHKATFNQKATKPEGHNRRPHPRAGPPGVGPPRAGTPSSTGTPRRHAARHARIPPTMHTGIAPPLETCCKAYWDTTCNVCWNSTPPPVDRHTPVKT